MEQPIEFMLDEPLNPFLLLLYIIKFALQFKQTAV